MTLTVKDEWGLTGASRRRRSRSSSRRATCAPVPVDQRARRAPARRATSPASARPTRTPATPSPTRGTSATARRPARRRAPSHTYAAAGTYTITLTITDGWGKAASTTRIITITEPATNAPPVPVISAGDASPGRATSSESARRTRTVTRSPTCGTWVTPRRPARGRPRHTHTLWMASIR